MTVGRCKMLANQRNNWLILEIGVDIRIENENFDSERII